MQQLTWRWRGGSSWRTRFRGKSWGHIRAGRLAVFLEQVLVVDAKLVSTVGLEQKDNNKSNQYFVVVFISLIVE